MNEEQVKKIVAEELDKLFGGGNKTVFSKNIQILNARNIQVGKGNGTQIGTEAAQKVGFHGVTPVIQANAVTVPTGGGTQDGVARNSIIEIIAVLHDKGLTA